MRCEQLCDRGIFGVLVQNLVQVDLNIQVQVPILV